MFNILWNIFVNTNVRILQARQNSYVHIRADFKYGNLLGVDEVWLIN